MKSIPIPERPTESRAGDILLLPIAGLAFWTLAYDLVLVLRWPAKTITWCFLAIVLAGFFLLARPWKKTNYAITILFVRRPNQDDVVYFYRALSQLSA
jgi:hypothetical protein